MITLTKEWLLTTIAELEEERDETPGAANESEIVRYWRQGRINTASIDRFNQDFEYLDFHEARRIRAELETSEHIKHLRAMRA